jgi:hypothetical protein
MAPSSLNFTAREQEAHQLAWFFRGGHSAQNLNALWIHFKGDAALQQIDRQNQAAMILDAL